MIRLHALRAALAACVLAACGGGGGGGATAAPPPTQSPPPPPPPVVVGTGPFIVVDQFGYRPEQTKIAVIRDPITGFDAADAFTPGATYQVLNASGAVVLSGAATAWNGGATDTTSGDRAWRFDFSALTAPGDYTIRDVERGVSSARFTIAANVYRPVLIAAVKTFFYQRAGADKPAAYAGAAWADGPSHVGPLQDRNARLYSAPGDAATERDLSGGWYDAGDPNKYTNWTAEYVIGLLHAYAQKPAIWTDDFGIPESGNGLPDLLDEIKWGLDWLVRMQNADGSVLSIVGMDGNVSPPSAATGQSLYGSASTSATLSSAAAYAYAAKVFAGVPNHAVYAADLRARAISAYAWADANPNVLFRNNDSAAGTQGLGAGQQETDDYGRAMKKLTAAIYLYDLTGEASYASFVDANYRQAHLLAWGWASPFEAAYQRPLLHYANLPGVSATVATDIENTFVGAMNSTDNWGAVTGDRDPYRAHIANYTWGSSAVKSRQGDMFAAFEKYGLPGRGAAEIKTAAGAFLHYLHGVNPLGKAYLSNMGALGAENSVDQFYHFWFKDGSARWDSVRSSTAGPAPGFVVGGPNPSYNWDAQCPGVAGCGAAPPSPPHGQPAQKSYVDFNTTWPLNSWEVTENSNGYQTDYILLLSRFVD